MRSDHGQNEEKHAPFFILGKQYSVAGSRCRGKRRCTFFARVESPGYTLGSGNAGLIPREVVL